jgi:magnesium-protoporphyrin O-methyltransferase
MFTAREASRTASRFRRKGLRGTASELASAVEKAVRPGGLLLEVGGGAGQIQIALLEEDAAAASLNLELSDNWEAAAVALIEEHGLSDRVERRLGDFVDLATTLPEVEAVVMHRVICCYPDWRAMLGAAIDRSRNVVGVTVPNSRWWTRAVLGVSNLLLWLRRMDFRVHGHPTAQMLVLMESAGFAPSYDGERAVWRTMVWKRKEPGPAIG